jgi:hypothetical protein
MERKNQYTLITGTTSRICRVIEWQSEMYKPVSVK